MKIAVLGVISSLAYTSASPVARLQCPEAARFGVLHVSPTTVSRGDTITITVDLTCAVETFGIVAEFIDYTLEVPAESNNGFEFPIVLARRTMAPGALSDSFTAKIPHDSVVAGTPYTVFLNNIYPLINSDGTPYLLSGGLEAGLTITN